MAYVAEYAFSVIVATDIDEDGKLSLAIMTAPPASSDEEHDDEHVRDRYWALRRVAFGFGELYFFPTLDNDDWAAVNELLSQSPYLQSIDLFCGNETPENDFSELVDTVRLNLPTVGGKVQSWYSPDVSDGREMASELFGTVWRRERIQQSLNEIHMSPLIVSTV